MRIVAAFFLLTAMCGLARAQGRGAGAAPPRQFALVIGNNVPPHAGLSRLRYADDDAVRWAVMFGAFGGDVEVLTELDDESRRLYGPLAFGTSPPSRASLNAAVSRLAARIATARAHGERTVAYFIYAGHGDVDVDDGRGYLALLDGRFTRADLAAAVLAPLGADTNHVIIDACRASSFLGNRGPGGERQPWQDAYFAPNAPRLANTGFLLASSASGLSHEWEEFQSGVFSHEVRSGLLGAADANGDGLVTYGELTGFVRLANLPIANERFRPRIVSRMPTDGDGVLVDLRGAPAGSLTFGPSQLSSHEMLEDHAGVRWADFHPGAAGSAHPIRLILPRPAWSAEGFYLRSLADNGEYAIPAGRDVLLADLAPQPTRALRRGALTDAFAHLFDLPFDQAVLDHLALDADLRAEAPARAPGTDLSSPRVTKAVGIGAVAAGGASLVAAGALVVSALNVRDTAAQANGRDRIRYNAEIDTQNRWAIITGVGGGVLAALGVGLLLWRRHAGDPTTLLW